ncbi:unnamed protein product [Chrysoparadoxa australica]
MSSSVLERAREFHEDAELYEKEVIGLLEEKPRASRAKVLQQHRVNNLLTKIVERNHGLESLYEDPDGLMKEEVASMRGGDALKTFYDRLKDTWSYHTRYPNLKVTTGPNMEEEMEPTVAFSGEEIFGKYFDLHSLFIRWVNLPQCQDKSMTYGAFLQSLTDIGKSTAEDVCLITPGKGYKGFVMDLRDYLSDFLLRTQPLVQLDELLTDARKIAEEQQARAKAAPEVDAKPQVNGEAKRPVDLKMFHTHESLRALGMERLKEGLEALGMKKGGTLEQRAERLFSVKGLKPGEIDKSLLASSSKKRKRGSDIAQGDKEVKLAEQEVRVLLEVMATTWEATIKQVDKKQTRTVEEREAELLEDEEGALPEVDEDDDDDSEDEGPIYNPLNLPLGWDGKPIPFWLYKLHGLGVEYKCEICGDFSYWGRRAFDRHFQEWRHAHGMRCLGIPNTKHFHDITLIEDARDLYSRLKGKLEEDQWKAEAGEEYEDSEGNVLNQRTYEDLARQGLL